MNNWQIFLLKVMRSVQHANVFRVSCSYSGNSKLTAQECDASLKEVESGQQKLNLSYCILAQKYLVYRHKGIIDLIQNL
jgi:hypothetical protein